MSDERHFERLFREHVAAVRAYALRRDPALAEDVVAETFAVCWRRLGDVPRDELPWLLGVARRTLANARRSRARQTALAARVADVRPEAETPLTGDGRIADALAGLSERDREILLLVAWDGLDRAGIARAIGCTRQEVRLRLHRARRRFAAAYAEPAPPSATILGPDDGITNV